ncbi:MAG: hypothetical protein JNL61_19210 [Rhizobiaceae bacterium]|nr:hypothetical protein [Rhizobiaceae bacterium]
MSAKARNIGAPKTNDAQRIDHFFSMPAARADRWRVLTAVAGDWAADLADAAAARAALATLGPIEEFHAFPGRPFMARLQELLETGSAQSFADLANLISRAMITRSYKRDADDWREDDPPPAEGAFVDMFKDGDKARRPYFEMLLVTPPAAMRNARLTGELRRLRRSEDAFAYEAVQVSSFA